MRVVVASDTLAGLDPTEASRIIAQAFAEHGVDVAVVPLAATGRALRESLGSSHPESSLVAPANSAELAAALNDTAGPLILDLTALRVDDLGREVLGAEPRTALEALRQRWVGRSLVALVPEGQVLRELTGLAGYASSELRSEGADLQAVLRADVQAQQWAAELGVPAAPGSGAARGLGLIVQALGGEVTDPLSCLVDGYGLTQTIAQSDLVVTGAESLDFHALGGPIVKRVAALASDALRPVIGIVGRNFVSARELRLAGFEAAYPLLGGMGTEVASSARLTQVAAQVARTWHW